MGTSNVDKYWVIRYMGNIYRLEESLFGENKCIFIFKYNSFIKNGFTSNRILNDDVHMWHTTCSGILPGRFITNVTGTSCEDLYDYNM